MTDNLFDLKKFLLIFIVSSISIFLYDFQIQAMNQHIGMKYIVHDFTNILTLIFNVLIVYILLNNKLKPSMVLLNIILLFIVLPFFLFFNLNGYITLETYLYYLLLLFIPILIIKVYSEKITDYFIKLRIENYFFKIELNIEKLLVFILIATFIIVSFKLELKFSFYDSYERRIESREILVGYIGYLFSISMNGIAPYLAFLAIIRKNYRYLFLSIIFTIICFGFIGVKAPFFYVCFFSFMALILKNSKINFNNFFYFIY